MKRLMRESLREDTKEQCLKQGKEWFPCYTLDIWAKIWNPEESK